MEHEPTRPRYVRSIDADEIARILDGSDHAEPVVVRRQREFVAYRKLDRRVAVACVILALLTALYFAVQLSRGAVS